MAVGLGPQPPMWSFRSRILCIFFRLFRRHRLYIERRSNFCCQLCCEKPLLTQQHRLQIVWHYPTPGRFRKTILMFHILDDMTARSLLEFNVVPTCLNSQLNHGDPKLLNREVGDTFQVFIAWTWECLKVEASKTSIKFYCMITQNAPKSFGVWAMKQFGLTYHVADQAKFLLPRFHAGVTRVTVTAVLLLLFPPMWPDAGGIDSMVNSSDSSTKVRDWFHENKLFV